MNNTSEKAKIRIVKYDSNVLKMKLKKKRLAPGENVQLLIQVKKNIDSPKAVTIELENVDESRVTIPIE